MPLPYYMTINTITTNTRGSRAETIGTTSHIPYSPLTAPHPPSKECQVREGKCDAFTTNSVVGCTGSEVRHAFASHLLLANPPRPSSTSPSPQAPCTPLRVLILGPQLLPHGYKRRTAHGRISTTPYRMARRGPARPP